MNNQVKLTDTKKWQKDTEDCTQLSKVNLYKWMSTMEPHRQKQLIDSLYLMAFHWLQQYKELQEECDEWKTLAESLNGDIRIANEELAKINCDYYADKQRFHDRGRELAAEKARADAAEAREQKLREAIDKAIREYGLWHDEGSAANVMVEILHNAVSSLYPKEETKP